MSVEHLPRGYRPFAVVDPFVVGCAYCGAPAFGPCQNEVTGKPLRKFTAHLVRLSDATQAKDRQEKAHD